MARTGLPFCATLRSGVLSLDQATDIYPFAHPEQAKQFHNIVGKLRCTVCQNQTLAESNAPLAIDLRDRLYQQVVAGRSDAQIIEFARTRYGDLVSYDPLFDGSTLLLWLGPLLLTVVALMWFLKTVRLTHRPDR